MKSYSKNLKVTFIKEDGTIRTLEGFPHKEQKYLSSHGTICMNEQLRTKEGQFAGKQIRAFKLSRLVKIDIR